MARYALKTFVTSIPTLLILVFIVVALVRLIPGSTADAMLADSDASAEDMERLREQLGLDRSIAHQYAAYLQNIADGSLGYSLYDGRPVREFIQGRIFPTAQLTLLALTLSSVLGIAIGTVSAVKRNSILDYVLRLSVNTSLGIPNFVVATVVVLLPAYYWGWSPPLNYVRFSEDPVRNLTFFITPVLSLGTGMAASVARVTRTSTLEVLHLDYVRTARAKGLGEKTVVFRHVLRNSLLPVLTLIGLQVAALISGVVIVEAVFSIPGLGTLLIERIRNRDYPVVQGITLITGMAVIVINLVVELLYGFLNPRLRAR